MEIKKGETPYKAAVSDWYRDEDGALVFKIISKRRKDGKIEFICYTQRSNGIKRVIQHISFAEDDFWKMMEAFEEALKKFFPKIKFDIQNVDLAGGTGYRVVTNNKLNILRLKIVSWLECKFYSFKTLFKEN